eukprot:ANDGO_06200.mRNA.1 Vegetative incompatibility protein HET-E-1
MSAAHLRTVSGTSQHHGGGGSTPMTPGSSKAVPRLLDVFWDLQASTTLLQNVPSVPEQMRCPISQEPMRNPVILPCLHSVDAASLASITAENSTDGNVVSCPVCRETCAALSVSPNDPYGRFVASVVDNKPIPETKPPCPVHPNQELVFWDLDDKKAVCAFCLLLGPAKGHRHCSIQDALKVWRRDLATFLSDAAAQDTWFQKTATDMGQASAKLEESANGMKDSISRSIDAMIHLLEQRKADLLADLDLVLMKSRGAVASVSTAVESQHEKLRSTTSASYGLFQTCTLEELLAVRHVMDGRWRSVLSQQETLHEAVERAAEFSRKGSQIAFDASGIETGLATQIEAFGRIVNPMDEDTLSASSGFSQSSTTTIQMQPALLDSQIDAYENVFTIRPHEGMFLSDGADVPFLWPITVCGPFVCCGDSTGAIHVYNQASLAHLTTLHGHTKTVCSIVSLDAAVSIPPRRIASGSYDGTIRIWNLDSNLCTSVIPAYPQQALPPSVSNAADSSEPLPTPVWSLCHIPASRLIAAGTSDGMIRFYDATPEQIISDNAAAVVAQGSFCGEFRASPSQTARVLSLTLSLDQRYLFAGSSDFNISVFDLLKNVEVCKAQTSAEVWSLCTAATGEIYAGVSGGPIEVWQWVTLLPSSVSEEPIKRLSRVFVLEGHANTVRSIACVGPRHVWSCGVDGRICVFWRWAILQRAAQVGRDDVPPVVRIFDEAHASFIYGLAHAGARVFSASDDGCIKIWDPAVQQGLDMYSS